MTNEIGRELKVSELKPRTVVVLEKSGHPTMATMWVATIQSHFVIFTSGVLRGDFMAQRVGPGLDEITDDTGKAMRILRVPGGSVKIDLGGGQYLEPDEGPRNSRFHMRIMMIKNIPTRAPATTCASNAAMRCRPMATCRTLAE